MSIDFTRAVIGIGLLAIASDAAAQAPQEIRLWPGKAPGSENWTVPEATTTSPTGDRTITNVSDPTVTVFLPAAASATGTAVVVAPGGALRLLGWDNEGVKVAQWLNSKGIAALVLKYRTLQTMPASGRGRGAPPPGPSVLERRRGRSWRFVTATPTPSPTIRRCGRCCRWESPMRSRRCAWRGGTQQRWRIDPARVGIMGFSAGGGIAVGTALAERSDASPDFLVSLYGPSLQDVNVPAHAPPLFIAVGSSHFNVTNGCLALFAAWKAAGKPAEIHVYDQVSAGFGMTKRGLPVDSWNDRLLEWLIARKLR